MSSTGGRTAFWKPPIGVRAAVDRGNDKVRRAREDTARAYDIDQARRSVPANLPTLDHKSPPGATFKGK